MKHWISASKALPIILAVAWLPSPSGSAEPPASIPATQPVAIPKTQPTGREPVKITLHPSATTQPALECKLLPSLLDQTPGDAAPLYVIANDLLPTAPNDPALTELWEPVDNPPDLPADQLAHDEKTESILNKCAVALRYVDLAARREDVHWEAGLREFGFDAQMPYLNHLRHFKNIMMLQVRFQLARGDLPGAMHTMQTSLAMTRQINRQPTLIEGLVADGFAESVLDHGVEGWIALERSSNLYWALSSLPQPYINYASIARSERAQIYFQFPILRQAAEGGELPAQQWRQIMLELIRLHEGYEPPQPLPPDRAKRLDAMVTAALPRAREFLVATGLTSEQVPSIPPDQAAGRFFFQRYRIASDEVWKAWELPYPQSIKLLNDADQRYKEREGMEDPFHVPMMRDIGRAKITFTRLDRYIALLRTIEALRDYLARHGGTLPARLEQIKDLPLPLDPFTDKPFLYQSDGRTAVLEALPPENMSPRWGLRYEITIAQ